MFAEKLKELLSSRIGFTTINLWQVIQDLGILIQGRYESRHYLIENETFSNMTLSEISYAQSESGSPLVFSNCTFENVYMFRCTFYGVEFNDCHFVNSSISWTNINMANVPGFENIIHANQLSFERATLDGCKIQFKEASNHEQAQLPPFQWLRFSDCFMHSCEFPNVLKDVSIRNGKIENTRFKSLHSSEILSTEFNKCELQALEFSGAEQATFTDSNITLIRYCGISGANFNNVQIKDIIRSDIRNTSLIDSNILGAFYNNTLQVQFVNVKIQPTADNQNFYNQFDSCDFAGSSEISGIQYSELTACYLREAARLFNVSHLRIKRLNIESRFIMQDISDSTLENIVVTSRGGLGSAQLNLAHCIVNNMELEYSILNITNNSIITGLNATHLNLIIENSKVSDSTFKDRLSPSLINSVIFERINTDSLTEVVVGRVENTDMRPLEAVKATWSVEDIIKKTNLSGMRFKDIFCMGRIDLKDPTIPIFIESDLSLADLSQLHVVGYGKRYAPCEISFINTNVTGTDFSNAKLGCACLMSAFGYFSAENITRSEFERVGARTSNNTQLGNCAPKRDVIDLSIMLYSSLAAVAIFIIGFICISAFNRHKRNQISYTALSKDLANAENANVNDLIELSIPRPGESS